MMNKEESIKYSVPGIPDEAFIRGNVPMTKEEIRVLTLTKLKLNRKSNVLDIGAGTGSLSIESALLARDGMVYAVERNEEAISLIKKNTDKFAVDNLRIIKGEAPFCIDSILKLDAVIVGGSGGNLESIVEKCCNLLKTGGRIVVNAILLETACEAVSLLEKYGFGDVDMIHVNIAKRRKMGGKSGLIGQNPIFIIWGEKSKREREV